MVVVMTTMVMMTTMSMTAIEPVLTDYFPRSEASHLSAEPYDTIG